MTRKNKRTAKAEPVTRETRAARCTELVPTAEEIRCRAHEIYQWRRCSGVQGDEETDWKQAERELTVHGDGVRPTALVDAESSVGEALNRMAYAKATNGIALDTFDQASDRVTALSVNLLRTDA
jgi:hypothetical protein